MRAHLLVAGVLLATGPFATVELRADQERGREQMRFRGMDRNGDGIITRQEWRGSDQSFRAHDWNGDGRLSGDEVRVGAARPRSPEEDWTPQSRPEFYDWNETGFNAVDRNRDGRVTPNEWRYGAESFRRADRNGDDELSRAEFLNAESDLDREDRFDYLDANRDGRLERAEWHGTLDAFEWLDRDRNGVLSRAEVVGQDTREGDLFAQLDANDDGRVALDEWHWSRRSFNRQDSNRDGTLSRQELSNSEIDAVGTTGGVPGQPQVVSVDSTERWVDSGIDVRAGDQLSIEAQGNIRLSLNGNDYAGPAGATNGRRAQGSPMPNRPAGALIARIGDATPLFVGDRARFDNVRSSGRLYLGVNDDHLADNEGALRVTVTLQRR